MKIRRKIKWKLDEKWSSFGTKINIIQVSSFASPFSKHTWITNFNVWNNRDLFIDNELVQTLILLLFILSYFTVVTCPWNRD